MENDLGLSHTILHTYRSYVWLYIKFSLSEEKSGNKLNFESALNRFPHH